MKAPLLALSAALLAACATPTPVPATEGEQVCTNRTGEHEGFYYSFWKDGGDACITLMDGGAYATDYDLGGRNNLVTGKGWRTGSVDRVVVYNANWEPGRNSYLTLYGWTTEPLIEYYVVDGWGTAFKPPGRNAEVLGTVESDGGTYEIYRTVREQKPSIRGTQTFDQYWSVRTEPRPLGVDSVITFANHVEAWRALGLELGEMDYQIMATEGFGAVGSSDITVWEER